MREESLRLEHLSKSAYGEPLLSDVNLSVYKSTFNCALIPDSRSRLCLAALLRGQAAPDGGLIYAGDRAVSPGWLRAGGAGCVSAKTVLMSQMSIAENIFYTEKRFFKYGFKLLKQMNEAAADVMGGLGINVSPEQSAGNLKPSQAHMIEIAAAFYRGSRIIVLDNIAENYTDREIAELRGLIARMNAGGAMVLLLTTKVHPLFGYADSNTVIAYGSDIASFRAPFTGSEYIYKYLQVPEGPVTAAKEKNHQKGRLLRLKGAALGKRADISVYPGKVSIYYDGERRALERFPDSLPKSVKIYIKERPARINSLRGAIKNRIKAVFHEKISDNGHNICVVGIRVRANLRQRHPPTDP